MTQRLFSKAGLLVLALLTLLLTVAINQVFKGARLDLTEDKLFTLSQGTHNLLKGLESDATLQLFYSDSQTQDLPFIRNYARRVTELLEEYVAASRGKLKLEVIDPEPFSENEDKAAEYGLQAIPLGGGAKEAYFGLVITSDGDSGKHEVISFLHPDKERFLEYDISKLVYSVTQKTKPKVGLISGLQVHGGFDMASRQSTGPWTSISQLEQLYDVTTVEPGARELPADLKLLVIIHPKDLSDQMRYAIDQFVLAGGNALVFVDPNAESESQGGMGGMMMGMGGDKSSSFEPLFKAWGISVDPKKVLADASNALSVGSPSGRPVRHLGILGYGENNFNKEDVVTSSLNSVNFATAGAVHSLEEGETTVNPLLRSSTNSMLMDADAFSMMFDPSNLYKSFKPTGEQYTLIARVTGTVKTAYPDGRPPEPEPKGDDKVEKKDGDAKAVSKKSKKTESKNEQTPVADNQGDGSGKLKVEHLSVSVKPVNIIVVADTDVLTDRLWVQKTSFFGQQIVQPFANNGDMLINMVDNLLGNADLISIRSRGQFSRPFERVNELERQAEASFHQKEDELKQRLSDTESKLRELQSKKEGDEKLVLSPEQEQEVEKFVQEKLKIRKELREVQHQLGKNIENLGSTLKLFNILAVPLLITLLVLGFRFYSRRRG
ncbi:Gldg family protein [Endozoicomonas sp. Mp262]|uniref:GldG family protein n=1 Tax=Endozoicomonas sp. Mp262 TaxID=2919499 RepID=UPI0021E0E44E